MTKLPLAALITPLILPIAFMSVGILILPPTAVSLSTVTKATTLGHTNALASSPTLTPSQEPLVFEFLGVPASYSPTTTHHSILDLQLWHDRIYLAHGDWTVNTGPVRAMYLDLKTEKFVRDEVFIFDDEAIEKFRVFSDTLYVAGTDAKESWDFGNLYIKKWGGRWAKLRTIPGGVHVFDVAVMGKTLIATGSNDKAEGVIWISRDGGRRWKLSFRFQSPYGNPSLSPVLVQSSLFVLAERVYVTTARNGCFVFNGDTWTSVNCLPVSYNNVHKNTLYDDVIAMIPYWNEESKQLYLFNGKESRSIGFDWPVRDLVSTKEGLFLLTGKSQGYGAIFYASDLNCFCEKDFTQIVVFDMSQSKPGTPRGNSPLSLEYANNRFYTGFADGRLYRSTYYKP